MSSSDGDQGMVGDFSPDEIRMLRAFFRDEARETLDRITTLLLRARTVQPDEAGITELMRTTHTLKGSAGTVGLNSVVELSHALEDEFARLRAGEMSWTPAIQDAFVHTVDALNSFIEVAGEPAGTTAEQSVRTHLTQLIALRAKSDPDASDPPSDPAIPARVTEQDASRDLATDKIAPRMGALPHEDAVPSAAAPITTGSLDLSGPVDISGPVDTRRDVLRVAPARVDRLMDSVGELVFDRTRIERRVQQLRSIARDLGRTRQVLRDRVASVRAMSERFGDNTLANELAGLEDALARQTTLLATESAALLEDTDALRQTSEALQDGLIQIRMMSVRSLFKRLARPLRNMARASRKRVRLEVSGEHTEFDKAVAEQIADPLIQLLRNAIAHGIEPETERLAAGKPPEGLIKISARQSGGSILIELSDDGRGIDPEALRARYVASGRWTQARADLASDGDVLRVIFEPGMSTRDKADELAGRGIGLDAVREAIARLGGEIELTSTPAHGTVFTLHLPVHTAVTQALLFKVHGQVYALPNTHVTETTQVPVALGQQPTHLTQSSESVPLVSLHDLLGTRIHFDAHSVPVIVLSYLDKRFAVTCDKVIGPRQIVVKPLGKLLERLTLYAGGTISGSGKVQLIFDSASLLRLAYPESLVAATPRKQIEQTSVIGRALVADDSRAIREAMSRIMARSGYIVDVAEDGRRAWEMVQELSYDLLITDLEMPFIDGFELIERIRDADNLKTLPVIIISSRDNAKNRGRADALAVSHFVAKPVTRRKVADALGRLPGAGS